jgi:membrane protease YdiL (CAAX protease family)
VSQSADHDEIEPTHPGYAQASAGAWHSLLFLLPLVVIYEWGTWYYTFDPITQSEQRIVAFSMLRQSLAAAGATAGWVAPASVISILLGLTLSRREKLAPRPLVLGGMLGECVILALPLILLSYAIARAQLRLAGEPFGEGVVLSIGAGVYEELVFRLIAFTALSFVLIDFLALSVATTWGITLVTTSLAFSLYHYWGPENFAMQTFVFRTAAGLYFGALLGTRGFGITAGVHAAYDISICVIRDLPHGDG